MKKETAEMVFSKIGDIVKTADFISAGPKRYDVAYLLGDYNPKSTKPEKSPRTNMTNGVTTIRNMTPQGSGTRFLRRN